jgi:excisionase family DNA binding protein
MGEQLGFLNIKEISGYLGIKTSTIYAMVAEKRIPHYRLGRQIRFKRADVDGWMEEQKQEVVDVKVEAKRIIRSVQKKAAQDVDRIVKKAVDEVKGKGYTSSYGKPDRIKGLRKEVKHGSL